MGRIDSKQIWRMHRHKCTFSRSKCDSSNDSETEPKKTPCRFRPRRVFEAIRIEPQPRGRGSKLPHIHVRSKCLDLARGLHHLLVCALRQAKNTTLFLGTTRAPPMHKYRRNYFSGVRGNSNCDRWILTTISLRRRASHRATFRREPSIGTASKRLWFSPCFHDGEYLSMMTPEYSENVPCFLVNSNF
jgi:hypothetical protein